LCLVHLVFILHQSVNNVYLVLPADFFALIHSSSTTGITRTTTTTATVAAAATVAIAARITQRSLWQLLIFHKLDVTSNH